MGREQKIRNLRQYVEKFDEEGNILEVALREVDSENFSWFAEVLHEIPTLKKLLLGSFEYKPYEIKLSFPQSLGNLKRLEELVFLRCQLRQVPSFVEKLQSLKQLTITYNWILELPEWIGNFPLLEWLNLSSNKLNQLADTMGKLETLQTLYLNGNQLTTLPESLLNLPNLRYIQLGGNPLKDESLLLMKKLEKNGVNIIY